MKAYRNHGNASLQKAKQPLQETSKQKQLNLSKNIKNLPAMQEAQEIQVSSLGQEDPLEKEMATHSSILAWRIPWTERPGQLQSIGSQRV